MSAKMNKARAGLGGMFLIGVFVTSVGVNTGNAGFYVPGIVFLLIGSGGVLCATKRPKDSYPNP